MRELTLRQRIAVTSRIVQGDSILALARASGTPAQRAKALRQSTTICGGSDAGDDVGSWWCGGKGAASSQTHPDWTLSWIEMAAIVDAGTTPGALAGIGYGLRRYYSLHGSAWGCRFHRFLCGHQVNAVDDALAYELIWWPEYVAATDLIRRGERQVWEQAYDALVELDAEQLVLL